MMVAGQVISGIVLGYILFSIVESIAHRYCLHARWCTRKSWLESGYLGTYITHSWYSRLWPITEKPLEPTLSRCLTPNSRKVN